MLKRSWPQASSISGNSPLAKRKKPWPMLASRSVANGLEAELRGASCRREVTDCLWSADRQPSRWLGLRLLCFLNAWEDLPREHGYLIQSMPHRQKPEWWAESRLLESSDHSACSKVLSLVLKHSRFQVLRW